MKQFIQIFYISFISINVLAQGVETGINDTTRNVLIITAHPDDWEGCMGGTTLLLARQGYKIHVLIASRGERGVRDEAGIKLTDLKKAGEIREKEAREAIKLINGTIYFMGKIDGEIYADKKGVDTIVHFLKKIRPSIVFTMWGVDVPDHAAAGNMALKALYLTGMIQRKEVYFMEAGRGVQTNQFVPDFYINISDVYNDKLSLVRCHVSQNRGDRLTKLTINQVHGQIARCEQAEVFKSYYPAVNFRWGNKINNTIISLPSR